MSDPTSAGDAPPDDDAGSPFDTETISFLVVRELFAVRLRDALRVAKDRIALDVAGEFLTRLEAVTYAIGGSILGRESGKRGPLRRIEIGGLALAAMQTGASADFHFKLAMDEQSRLTPDGEVVTVTQDALTALEAMIDAAAAEDHTALLELSRLFGQRAARNFGRLLETLVDNDVATAWRFDEHRSVIELTQHQALGAQLILEREADVEVEVIRVEGLLYEAHSRRHHFELAVTSGAQADKIRGTFGEEQREEIRAAWDRFVEVELRRTTVFLERQDEAFDTRYELLSIVRIEA